MTEEKSQYEKLGVDPDKTIINEIFGNDDEVLFSHAWVKIKPDLWEPETHVMTMHADGVGSLTIDRLICFFETGDPAFLEGDIVNAFEMNMDIAAAGFAEKIVECDVINVNQNTLSEDVKIAILQAKKKSLERIITLYNDFAFNVVSGKIAPMGGETADLPDQTSNCILDLSFFSRMPKENVITGNVQPGDVIFGLSSGGQTIWEKEKNYGGMSNGSTHKRIYLFHPDYGEKYPFLVSPQNALVGPFRVDEYISELGTTMGIASTSPTRHVGIIMKLIVDELKKLGKFDLLSGIVLVSGGGLKKVINLGEGIRYEISLKEEMILPLFKVIQGVSKETWYNMFKTYNNGICLQFIGSPEGGILESAIRTVAEKIQIGWYPIGKCLTTERADGKNEVTIYDWSGTPHYYDK